MTIRVGIVGVSAERGWAARAHLPALRALSQYELVALATTRESSAAAAAAQFGIPLAFADPREMIARSDVNLVTICVKVANHFELARAAIEAGKHVSPCGVRKCYSKE